MPTIHFPAATRYRYLPGLGLQPALDVTLYLGTARAGAPALLDSGAHLSVFSLDVAEALQITDVFQGRRTTVATVAGSRDLYLFDLEMEVRLANMARRFPAQVGFFPAVISRNILGRNLIFAHFLIGFHESHQVLYLRPEE